MLAGYLKLKAAARNPDMARKWAMVPPTFRGQCHRAVLDIENHIHQLC